MSDDADVLYLSNSMDVSAFFSVPKGFTNKSTPTVLQFANIELLAGESMTLDCRANDKRLAKGIIQVKVTGTLPTIGKVKVTVAR